MNCNVCALIECIIILSNGTDHTDRAIIENKFMRDRFLNAQAIYNGDGIDKTIINIDQNNGFSNDEPFFKIESTSYVTWNNLVKILIHRLLY